MVFSNCQVGIPVLGVVENMSRLLQPVSAFRFLQNNADVTETVKACLREKFGSDQVSSLFPLTVCPETYHLLPQAATTG